MPLAEEIYQEGLRIPPDQTHVQGKLNRDIWDIILLNVRTPEEREGDLAAMLGANTTGERRLDGDRREIRINRGESLRHRNSELQRTHDAPCDLHDSGRNLQAEDFLDNDGINDKPIAIRVKIRIRGDKAAIDFSDSDPQAEGSVNAVYAITASAVFYVFRTLVGCIDSIQCRRHGPLEIIAPEGTIVNARPPAAVCGGNVETSQRIVDVLYRCLAEALPDRIPAASQGTMNNFTFGGIDPRTSQPVAYYETVSGGMGARSTMDGLSGVHTHMTNSLNTPVEALGQLIRFASCGIHFAAVPEAVANGVAATASFAKCGSSRRRKSLLYSDRRKFAPYGLHGGEPGAAGSNILVRNDGKREVLPSKLTTWVEPGDTVSIQTPGGGGWGQ